MSTVIRVCRRIRLWSATGTNLQEFDMASRCRLYTSNDEDAVIEHVSAYMWERRMERVEDRTPWAEADATWQTAFREMAVAAQQALTMP